MREGILFWHWQWSYFCVVFTSEIPVLLVEHILYVKRREKLVYSLFFEFFIFVLALIIWNNHKHFIFNGTSKCLAISLPLFPIEYFRLSFFKLFDYAFRSFYLITVEFFEFFLKSLSSAFPNSQSRTVQSFLYFMPFFRNFLLNMEFNRGLVGKHSISTWTNWFNSFHCGLVV